LSLRKKLILLLIGNSAAVSLLFVYGWLSLQGLLILWNVSAVVGIVLTERERKKSNNWSLSTDDKEWVSLKKELDRVLGELGRSKKRRESSKSKILERRKTWIENEMRRLEWRMREDQYDKLSQSRFGAPPVEEKKDLLAHEEGEAEDFLIATLNGVRELATSEENSESLRQALLPTLSSLRAHYNIIRRRNKDSGILRDIWVVWAVVASVADGITTPEPDLLKYSSDPIKKAVSKLLKELNSKQFSKKLRT
jgi:hypothetical protein